jgi:hypothetical protein
MATSAESRKGVLPPAAIVAGLCCRSGTLAPRLYGGVAPAIAKTSATASARALASVPAGPAFSA